MREKHNNPDTVDVVLSMSETPTCQVASSKNLLSLVDFPSSIGSQARSVLQHLGLNILLYKKANSVKKW